jgi:hypothetical protein
MTSSPLDTDYLVVGAGATAMAFVDTLLSESPDATVVMVDRHHRPGGHWNVAYPFVRVHQPAAWYGVATRELGSGAKDAVGPNAGLYELASGAEVLAHFDQVLRERFLPSGRVRWLPMSEYATGPDGRHRVTSLTNGTVLEITVRRKHRGAGHPSAQVRGGRRRALRAGESTAVHHAPTCRLHGGRLGQDRHRRLPVVAGTRRAPRAHPLDHAARRLVP